MRTYFLKLISLLFIVGMSSSSCRDWKCIKGSGVVVDETRDVGTFSRIVSNGDYYINIVQDSAVSSVVVSAEDNLMPYIETKVEDGVLTISKATKRCINPKKQITIYIRNPEFEHLEIAGSGTIKSDYFIIGNSLNVNISGSGEIKLNDIDYISANANISGSGDIKITGVGSLSSYYISGSGTIDAAGFQVSDCNANIVGSGNIYVWAERSLNATISGQGDIRFVRVNNLNVNSAIPGKGAVGPM